MILKTDIEEFLSLALHHPVIDVRSPGEYSHAHIPGAHNLPLFSDEERKIVGTAYKRESREQAIKIGLDFFGVKMRKMVEDTETILKTHPITASPAIAAFRSEGGPSAPARCLLVHCWRGGMRSAGVAWLLDLYGFKVYTLKGGYKAYRQWTLQQFSKPYPFHVLGGYTGSGKTIVLHELAKKKHQVLDLEDIANHKGSAFGGLGKTAQPSQEMFENKLALQLSYLGTTTPVWVEDESRRIGDLNLPADLWNTMRSSPVFFLDIPVEKRLEYIVQEYGKFKKEELVATVMRIRKRLGGLATKNVINHLLEDNITEGFRILLQYYDKFYGHDLHNRNNVDTLLTTIPSDTTNPTVNSSKTLAALTTTANN